MSLVPHKFDEANHRYIVHNNTVLATSDVIFLNGLYDVGQIPTEVLEFAGHRGSSLHQAIRAYEMGESVEDVVWEYDRQHRTEVSMAVMDRMKGYYRFRDKHEVTLMGVHADYNDPSDEMEISRVYEHWGTGTLIGATIDFPCYVDGQFTIVDLKSSHRNYGKKEMQDHLKWRMQLQSYKEAILQDDEFWLRYKKPRSIKKAILHLHPNEAAGRRGWEYHIFKQNDAPLWNAMVKVATTKFANGFKLDERG